MALIFCSSRVRGALLLLIMSTADGCASTQHFPFNATEDLGQVSGVTMRSGTEIKFADKGASVSNDTLYAVGREGQLMLPADSISRVSIRRFSAGRTVGMGLGLAAGLFGALLLLVTTGPFLSAQ